MSIFTLFNKISAVFFWNQQEKYYFTMYVRRNKVGKKEAKEPKVIVVNYSGT